MAGCWSIEKVDNAAFWTGVLIAEQRQVTARTKDVIDLLSTTLFRDHKLPRRATECGNEAMQEWIVERTGYGIRGETKHPGGHTTDLEVAVVAGDDDQRSITKIV